MGHFDQLKPQCPGELIASGSELKFYESAVLVLIVQQSKRKETRTSDSKSPEPGDW